MDVDKVARQAFSRYHARLAVDTDSFTLLGTAIYLSALRPVFLAPGGGWIAALKVLALAVECLWPLALRRYTPRDTHLAWRDWLFSVHWVFQHVYALHLLRSIGIDFQPQLLSLASPPAFVAGFFLCRPLFFLLANTLVFRMKARNFLLAQPVVLLLSVPEARQACRWAATHHPGPTQAAFGGLVNALRATMGGPSAMRAAMEPAWGDPYTACMLIDTYASIAIGLLLPALVIWWMEQPVWRDFALRDPAALTWPGGPSAERIAEAQVHLKAGGATKPPPRFPLGVGAVLAVLCWQLLESVL